jgi:uroporphyrinogen-III synthase
MRVIVTRTEPDSQRLAARLRNAGHDAVCAPLIFIRYLTPRSVPNRPWQAILVTSANALHALENAGSLETLLSVPLLAVGPASAMLARSMGFTTVKQASGNLPGLVELAKNALDTHSGPLLYLTGRVRSGDLSAELKKAGFDTQRIELYDTAYARELPFETKAAISAEQIEAVMLFSRRTAQTWADIVAREGLIRQAEKIVHVCLSAAIAQHLLNTMNGNIRVAIAETADEDAMVEALENLPAATQKNT